MGRGAQSRRHVLMTGAAFVGVSACAPQPPKVYDLLVSRDDGCTCCASWVEEVKKSGRFKVSMFDAGDLLTFKRSAGVPTDLAGCHTAKVEGFIIEGHVPADDILRLLETRPANVVGLAVPGMPRGSPGMEQPNGAKDAFVVFAFDAQQGRREFARHNEV